MEKPEVGTPLLGRPSQFSKTSIARYVAILTACAACLLIAVLLNTNAQGRSVLAANPVKYYYVPRAAVKNSKLPLHLMIPQGNGAIEYTLVSAPFSQLDGNATAPAANASADPAKGAAFVCTLENIKKSAEKAYARWDKCLTATDYKKPNADAKRRLLSVEGSDSRTQSLKWVWVPAKGESKVAPAAAPMQKSVSQSMWEMLEGNATTAAKKPDDAKTTLKECEAKAVTKVCTKLATCKDPVCANYYNDPDVERICGICTMAATGGFGCVAASSSVEVEGRGSVTLGDVQVGERLAAADGQGRPVYSRVYFAHNHGKASATLVLHHSAGALELTPQHSVPVFTSACGLSFCDQAVLRSANKIRAGDRIYVKSASGFLAQEVYYVAGSEAKVRYVLTEAGNFLAGGALASVRTTAAGPLETLPFRLLDSAWPGALQLPAVAAALRVILDSPMLASAQTIVERVSSLAGRGALSVPRASWLAAASSPSF